MDRARANHSQFVNTIWTTGAWFSRKHDDIQRKRPRGSPQSEHLQGLVFCGGALWLMCLCHLHTRVENPLLMHAALPVGCLAIAGDTSRQRVNRPLLLDWPVRIVDQPSTCEPDFQTSPAVHRTRMQRNVWGGSHRANPVVLHLQYLLEMQGRRLTRGW